MSTATHATPPAAAGRTRRRGSVLILVVALVVLLALMGTAYLSSTSNERYTAAANGVNTEGDVVLENIVEQLRVAITNDTLDPSQPVPGYRTPNTLAVNPSATAASPVLPLTDAYHNYDAEQSKTWLASRIPTLRDDTLPYAGNFNNAAPTGASNPNLAGFDTVSWPLIPTPNAALVGVSPGGVVTQSELAYQFYNPATGLPLVSVGQVYSPAATYTLGDIVSDGPPTNRFFRYINVGGLAGTPTTNTTYWAPLDQAAVPAGTLPYTAKQYYRYEPSFLGGNFVHTPAMNVYTAAAASGTAMTYTLAMANVPAADADGDGIADSLWCLVPGGPVNGITYYYATRVVDNAAAINANSAYSMSSDFDQSGNHLGATTSNQVGYTTSQFPANVGLAELMFDFAASTGNSSDAHSVANYWFRNDVFHDNLAGPPYADGTTLVGSPTPRGDFQYMTQGDALYHQLVRRMDNPGWRALGAVDPPYASFTQADGLSLASRFCLAPADGSTNGALESVLPELSYQPSGVNPVFIPNAPYDAAAIGAGKANAWFDHNFNFNDDLTTNLGINTRPLRAMLVTRNGVTVRASGPTVPFDVNRTAADLTNNYVDVINPLMLPYDPDVANPYDGNDAHLTVVTSAPTYQPGQWIKYYDAEGNWRVYRCLKATTVEANIPPDPRSPSATNPYLTPNQYWALESWSPTATKTSINTASFPELWRGFYNVMADKWDTAANTLPDPATVSAGAGGAASLSTGTTGTGVGTDTTVAAPRVGVAMFKSPLRYATPTGGPAAAGPAALSDIQMVQLRSALAAANALVLRGVTNDVTSRNVVLYDSPKVTARRAAVYATVFGGAKQPFITKVVIVDRSGQNKQPWVAVELYNPYVQVQFPTGEQTPNNGNGITFHLGKLATKPATFSDHMTKTANDVYLGCRLGILTRSATAGTLTLTEAENEYGLPVSNLDTAPALAPGKYLVLVSDQTDYPMSVTFPPVGSVAGQSQSFEVKSLVNLAAPAPTTAVPAGGAAPTPPSTLTPSELVLYRTRSADGYVDELRMPIAVGGVMPNVDADVMQQYQESGIWDLCPFDQVDLTGSTALSGGAAAPVGPGGAATGGIVNLYYRPTQDTVNTPPTTPAMALDYWKCVFPIGPGQAYAPGTGEPMAVPGPVPPSTTNPFQLGIGYNGSATQSTPAAGGAAPGPLTYTAGVPWHVIQVNNTDWPGPHQGSKPTPAAPFPSRVYPIAGFGRNGDMLQVPFIGNYTLATAALGLGTQPTLVEVNSVTMDALYAEDSKTYGDGTGLADDPNKPVANAAGVIPPANGTAAGQLLEQVGRFCPLTDTAQPLITDPNQDMYAWAGRLFDYFTVQAPQDDYMPNADPATYTNYVSSPLFGDLPVPVPNALGTGVPNANTAADSSTVQGLVNINTASWRTLSMLPLVRYCDADGPALDGAVNVTASAHMAQLIVKYRQLHGPFKSIMDLNKVVDNVSAAITPTQAFQSATNTGGQGTNIATISFNPATDRPTTAYPLATPEGNVTDARQALFTPTDGYSGSTGNQPYAYPLFSTRLVPGSNYGPTSAVYDDFQAKFLAFDRISNLITTRSDSFTCYVVVQGWQNGSVVSQRRSAFVIDRAPVGYQLNALGQRVLNTTPVVSHVAGG